MIENLVKLFKVLFSKEKTMNIIKSPSPNKSKRDYILQILVIHGTAGLMPGCLEWLRNPQSKVSCHYLITQAGTIHELVYDDECAWHCGESSWMGVSGLNQLSIGIELEIKDMVKDLYSAAQIASLVELCGELIKRWPIRHIVGHEQIAPGRKFDPGKNFPWAKIAAAFPDIRK